MFYLRKKDKVEDTGRQPPYIHMDFSSTGPARTDSLSEDLHRRNWEGASGFLGS